MIANLKLKIYDKNEARERHTGTIKIEKERKMYVIHRWPEHYFRKYQGYGISIKNLETLQRGPYVKMCGPINLIILIYHKTDGTEELYESTVQDWYDKGIAYDNKGDSQLVLAQKYMTKR